MPGQIGFPSDQNLENPCVIGVAVRHQDIGNDVIKDFEWGTDVSVEGKSEGFTHCFMVTFADDKARDTYLPHAAHKEFVTLVGPRIEKVLVVDYWTKE